MKFEFVEKKERYTAKIKVAGVGGAGGNAINNMINTGLKGVDYIVANTDCQDIDRSMSPNKLQLGPCTTMGLGAGADPEIGRVSAEESIDEIRDALEGFDMVFVTAGMGGGTGTGASPIIAKAAKETGALTVAVVTKPFNFEGDKRMKRAMEGVERLREQVDTLIIIPNERLKSLGGRSTTFKELIARADNVLLQAVRGISDLIMSNGFINLDFADIKRVMEQMGSAIMGTGVATGENRACEAAQTAINSPLLEGLSIGGAKGLLMNITGPSDMTMDEIDEAASYIKEEVHEEAEIFWGMVFDDSMEDEVQVTVIATGIDSDEYAVTRKNHNNEKVLKLRDIQPEEAGEKWTVKKDGEILDIPTFKRTGAALAHDDEQEEEKEEKKSFLGRFYMKNNLEYPTFLRVKAD